MKNPNLDLSKEHRGYEKRLRAGYSLAVAVETLSEDEEDPLEISEAISIRANLFGSPSGHGYSPSPGGPFSALTPSMWPQDLLASLAQPEDAECHPEYRFDEFGFRIDDEGYIKELDAKPSPTSWGAKQTIGNVMAEFSNSGWVHCVAFSRDGSLLAWVSHDSSISIADSTKGMAVTTVKTKYLPFLTCIWANTSDLIVAGYDCCPMLFQYKQDQLTFVSKLDKSQKKEVDGFSAMRKFRDLDKRALVENLVGDTLLATLHQNAITLVTRHSDTGSFCTSAMDGNMVIWDMKVLDNALAGLKIA
ncbi:ARPC1A [Cordylochernes scorpioides]|uniref:Arp2/3 complex 41 kDa subunit n=1 Tax=Cordylochernes scorpioides TaxID=51811 RepID=A0ABY6KS59_9ARAC|nr:ARPC1A [Cordylochernes scorpioides]